MKVVSVISLCLFFLVPCRAKEPDSHTIRRWIEQLASGNPFPVINNSPSYRLPESFDHTKQQLVRAARKNLYESGPLAFSFLIEHWNDTRYSMTWSNGISGAYRNVTVGEVCKAIVYDQLQPYGFLAKGDVEPPRRISRPGYPDRFLGSKKRAERWWSRRQADSLFDLQLEVIDWVIRQESKRSNDFSLSEKQEVEKIRSQLLELGKPLKPGSYSGYDTEF